MRSFLLLLPIATMLAACSTVTSDLPSAPAPTTWPASGVATSYVNKVWWTQGSDATLINLLSAADHNSHDIKIADARLKEARAAHVTIRSLLFPDISAAGVAQRGDVGLTYGYRTINITQGELDASFDLDLFGGLKARSKAAKANATAANASVDDVKGAVRLEIIAAYIGLRQCQQNLVSLQTTVSAAHEISNSLKQQWQQGFITEGQWQASDIDARAADSGVSRYKAVCEQYTNVISVLVGDDQMTLRASLLTVGPVPNFRHPDTTDAPLAILRQRPDIKLAEAGLTAARASTSSAQASLFPNVSIGGFFGSQDSNLNSSVDVWNAAATVYWPLLNFGRIKGQIDAASAREMQAYEGYRLVAIAALADVRTKLTALDQADYQQKLAFSDLQAASRRNEEARRQYTAGLTPKIAFLASTLEYEASRRAFINAEADRSIKAAALYRAEGL